MGRVRNKTFWLGGLKMHCQAHPDPTPMIHCHLDQEAAQIAALAGLHLGSDIIYVDYVFYLLPSLVPWTAWVKGPQPLRS